MEKTNTSIVFESREEIGDVIRILESWMDANKNDEKIQTAKKMVRMLDAIEMNW